MFVNMKANIEFKDPQNIFPLISEIMKINLTLIKDVEIKNPFSLIEKLKSNFDLTYFKSDSKMIWEKIDYNNPKDMISKSFVLHLFFTKPTIKAKSITIDNLENVNKWINEKIERCVQWVLIPLYEFESFDKKIYVILHRMILKNLKSNFSSN